MIVCSLRLFLEKKVVKRFSGSLTVLITKRSGDYFASVWDNKEKLSEAKVSFGHLNPENAVCISDKDTNRALLMIPCDSLTHSPNQIGLKSWLDTAAVNGTVFFSNSKGATSYTFRRDAIAKFICDQNPIIREQLISIGSKVKSVEIFGPIPHGQLQSLTELPNVSSLTLDVAIEQSTIDELAKLTQIKILDLRYVDDLHALSAFLEFRHLKTLRVSSKFKGQLSSDHVTVEFVCSEY